MSKSAATPKRPPDELEVVSTAIANINAVSSGLAKMAEQYKGVVYEVTNPQGMEDAKAARRAIREPRYNVEKIRKEAKAPLLALGKKLDSEAQRITGELLKLETPIDEQIRNEEDRIEAERQAQVLAEEKRVKDLQDRVAYLRGNPGLSVSDGSAVIAEHLSDLRAEVVDSSYEEFEEQAADAKTAGVARLHALHAAALANEAEQERIRRERAELEELREAEKLRQAEALRIQNETNARQQEEIRKEREALAAQQAEQNLREAALQEIMAIRHQTLIADTGRAPYIKGRTVEGVDTLIKETEAWPITEEKFGVLTQSATEAKETTLTQLRERRAQFVAIAEQEAADKRTRDEQVAEAQRLAEERQAIENEKAAAKDKADREAAAALTMAALELEAAGRARDAAKRAKFPGEAAIVAGLAAFFKITEAVANKWIAELRMGKTK